eukprot:808847-Pyramimonas_sp.AAC.1
MPPSLSTVMPRAATSSPASVADGGGLGTVDASLPALPRPPAAPARGWSPAASATPSWRPPAGP